MADYTEPIGKGAAWVKEGKKGKYLSWVMEFPVNANVPIKVSGVAFRNDKKQSDKSPDYQFIVNKLEYPEKKAPKPDDYKAKPGEYSGKEEDSDSIPF